MRPAEISIAAQTPRNFRLSRSEESLHQTRPTGRLAWCEAGMTVFGDGSAGIAQRWSPDA